jgi:hypothetical protein
LKGLAQLLLFLVDLGDVLADELFTPLKLIMLKLFRF